MTSAPQSFKQFDTKLIENIPFKSYFIFRPTDPKTHKEKAMAQATATTSAAAASTATASTATASTATASSFRILRWWRRYMHRLKIYIDRFAVKTKI